MENTGKEMSPLVANSKCPNCSNNLNFTVNVPEELAKIGRKFREEKHEAEKKVAALEEEKKNLEDELAKRASGAVSPRRRRKRRVKPGLCASLQGQLKWTRNDKEKLEYDLIATQQEKKGLEEKVKNLEKEHEKAQKESRGERQKSVAVAGVAQQQEREQPAPQAHIQPHLRTAIEGPSAASRAVSPTQGDNETLLLLLEESMERIRTLETETKKLKAENEDLQKTSTLKEERAKTVLKTARAKIQKSEDEKKKLELELEQIGE